MYLSPRQIGSTFNSSETKVFSRAELNRVIAENLDSWQVDLPADTVPSKSTDLIATKSGSQTDILNALLEHTQLQAVRLPFPYRGVVRYTWGDAPTFQIIQSLDDKGYFSHYTSMQLHGLTDQIPKTVYFNVEQPATGGGGTLSQDAINRAFKGRCRVSSNTIKFRDLTIVKLNGQNTGELGVITTTLDEGYGIRITNLERTLIDAVVRPVYAGGVAEVAQAFKVAADRVSVNRMVAYLRKLNYTYPFHQAIGFYLENAGSYTPSQISQLRQFPIRFDFYLNYQIKNPVYHETWRLFTPQGF